MFMSLWAALLIPSLDAYLISFLTALRGTAMVPSGTFMTCAEGQRRTRGSRASEARFARTRRVSRASRARRDAP